MVHLQDQGTKPTELQDEKVKAIICEFTESNQLQQQELEPTKPITQKLEPAKSVKLQDQKPKTVILIGHIKSTIGKLEATELIQPLHSTGLESKQKNKRNHCVKCSIVFTRRTDLSDHYRTSHANEARCCPHCQFAALLVWTLNSHIRQVHKTNIRVPEECPTYSKNLDSVNISPRMKSYKVIDESAPPKKTRFEENTRTEHIIGNLCAYSKCDQAAFTGCDSFKKHANDVQAQLPLGFKCVIEGCDFTSQFQSHYMVYHYREVHRLKYSCPSCHTWMSKLSEVKEHIAQEHNMPQEE